MDGYSDENLPAGWQLFLHLLWIQKCIYTKNLDKLLKDDLAKQFIET